MNLDMQFIAQKLNEISNNIKPA